MKYAALLVCVGLWGAVFVGVHELLPVLDPEQMVTLRFLAVALTFAALLLAHPAWRPKLTRREWGITVLSGLLAVPVCQLAIVEGQRYLELRDVLPKSPSEKVQKHKLVAAELDRPEVCVFETARRA